MMHTRRFLFKFTFLSCGVLIHLSLPAIAQELPLDKIVLPKGFAISVFARDVPGARSMTLSPSGTLFVGTRAAGKVY
ncbi:MAG: hypothetical protein V3T19_11760, partial [Acidiferrobacterales bacterium]